MDIAFNKWCEKLLDTGNGNRLINFKESKQRTVEILAPDISAVFERVENGKTLSFFDIDTYIETIEIKNSNSHKEVWEEDKVEVITKQKIVDDISGCLSKNQILSYRKDVTLNSVLNGIKKIASTSILEKGVNILYLAFGFLHWQEDDTGDLVSSPLVLIPISLNKKSAMDAFEIHEYEDEIDTNPTLLYKLKNEYNVILPEFRDTSEEETILEYIVRVRKAVEAKGWTVSKDMHIGTFSFLKLNMYKDLKENEDKIVAEPIIKKLLNRKIEEDESTEEIKNEAETESEINVDEFFKDGKEITLRNVVDADSSQMAAIIKAKSGKNLVLQGPPGTGKSQTITNLIAELLYDGKKILFVSEKLAALNVVFNNLKKAGLSDFCLELHSNKTNKKDVIDELYRVLTSNKKFVNETANAEIDELKKVKEQLDDYAGIMHSVQPCVNKTPYQMLEIISKYNYVPTFEYVISDIQSKGSDYLKEALIQLGTLSSYALDVGADYHKNNWYGYINQDNTYQIKIGLKEQLTKALKLVEVFSKDVKVVEDKLNIDLNSIDIVKQYAPYFKKVGDLTYFDNCFFAKDTLKPLLDEVKRYNKNRVDYATLKHNIEKIFVDDVFELNGKDYYLRFKNDYISSFRWFNANYRHDKKVLINYFKDKKYKCNYSQFVSILKDFKDAQEIGNQIVNDKQKIINLLSNKAEDYDWDKLENELDGLYSLMPDENGLLKEINQADFKVLQLDLREFIQKYNVIEKELDIINKVQESFDKDVCNFNKLSFDVVLNKIKALLNDFSSLDNWIKFYGTLINVNELGLKEFVDKFISLGSDINLLDKTFEAMFYSQWLYYVIDKNKILHNFSRLTQDSAVSTFKQKDKLKFAISKAEIIAKLMQDMPSASNMASGSQVSTLVREANKKRKQKPVRLLLQEVGQVVQKLKPCFLMSPLSVSTYLNSDTCKFDVVIFDEASQIFPWDAIGAISRGQQVIVVGDSRQMPPSNFFTAGIIDEEDEDEIYEDDSLDFESILDLCTATFEQNRLNWHYRSKTEELIAFSNANFYENSLTTFPSAYKDNVDMGVDFYYVPDGVFDRKTKSNLIEAEQVVKLVFEHFKNHPDRSLGVVAFSISQQAAIENIIQRYREKDDSFAKFFDDNRPEPFFVKNLETVQGDERDTIIFSVAYAKDSSGKFIHNFGPLNQNGGERRLNVAITRAKYNVKLVSSIRSYDIDLNRTSALGAKLLKDYLEYAEQGTINIDSNIAKKSNTETYFDFETEVYNVLKDAGYQVDMQVGCSEQRIDLGVKYPNSPDYVLAIECDGEMYSSARTTRDRDRLRQEVLEKMGWVYYRIWSIDWFTNKETEKKKLLAKVAKAIEDFGKKDENANKSNKIVSDTIVTEKKDFIIEKAPLELKSLFKTYNNYDFNSKQITCFDDFIYDFIATEAPITEDLLLNKIMPLVDRKKITSAVRLEFERELNKHKNIYRIKDYYVVDAAMKIEMRIPKDGEAPRDISMICNDELASGMLVIIKNNVGITRDGLFSTITNLLGYARKGNIITNKLSDSLNQLLQNKQVKEINGELFLK